MSKTLICMMGVLILLFLSSISYVVFSFDKVQHRYNEIKPDLDNYSAGEILDLSYEKLKISLLTNDGEDYYDYKIKMGVFNSKIKILENHITLGNAFYKDDVFLKNLSSLRNKFDELKLLNNQLFDGDVQDSHVLSYLDSIENTIIDLQEDIYRIQISSFSEATGIINASLDRAKWFTVFSVFLLFLIIVISMTNAIHLKEIIKRKNLFISSIYHELAGSVQSIVMAVDIIEHELKQDDLKPEVKKISYHTNKIIEQTREVMDYSKFELGKVEIKSSAVCLAELVSESVLLYSSMSKNVFYMKVMSNNIVANTDKYKLSRVLINLIDNANKFTRNGSVFINAKYMNDIFYLRVRDTGTGFDIKELKNMYKAFNQGSEKSTRQGLGLGLTIIKHYVDLLGGGIRVHSEVSKGATFFIFIPMKLVKK